MNPLLYVAIVLSLGAIGITAYALLRAPEGYEDSEGFHAVEEQPAPKSETATENEGTAGLGMSA